MLLHRMARLSLFPYRTVSLFLFTARCLFSRLPHVLLFYVFYRMFYYFRAILFISAPFS